MSKLNASQIAYLRSQEIGRIATAGADGQPHVTPVNYELDEDQLTIVIPGFDPDSKKYRDLVENPKAGFVVDDITSWDPFVARGVTIRGSAEIAEAGGEWHSEGIGGSWLRIRPERVVSWGLEGDI